MANLQIEVDLRRTSAAIPSWKHRLLSEVAQLRKRDMLECQSPGQTTWALTGKGVSFARAAAPDNGSWGRELSRQHVQTPQPFFPCRELFFKRLAAGGTGALVSFHYVLGAQAGVDLVRQTHGGAVGFGGLVECLNR